MPALYTNPAMTAEENETLDGLHKELSDVFRKFNVRKAVCAYEMEKFTGVKSHNTESEKPSSVEDTLRLYESVAIFLTKCVQGMRESGDPDTALFGTKEMDTQEV